MLDNETFEGIETETAAQAELVAEGQSNAQPTSEVARETKALKEGLPWLDEEGCVVPYPKEQLREVEPVVFNPETGEVTDAPGRSSSDLSRPLPQTKRSKRTEQQMIRALGGSSLKEASYVLDRVAKLEEKISELMGAISQKGRERVIEERPDLAKY